MKGKRQGGEVKEGREKGKRTGGEEGWEGKMFDCNRFLADFDVLFRFFV